MNYALSWYSWRNKILRQFTRLTEKNSNFRRIYHYHIRKSGGTSLNWMFLALGGVKPEKTYKKLLDSPTHKINLEGRGYVGWNTLELVKGDYFYGFSHKPLHRIFLPPNTFTITVLRDPLQRIISYYRMVKAYSKKKDQPNRELNQAITWLGNSFGEFVENLPRERLHGQLWMFSNTFDVNEAVSTIKQVDMVMFTDAFNEGARQLATTLDLDLKPLFIRKGKEGVKISGQEKDRVEKMLKDEYRFYNQIRKLNATEKKKSN